MNSLRSPLLFFVRHTALVLVVAYLTVPVSYSLAQQSGSLRLVQADADGCTIEVRPVVERKTLQGPAAGMVALEVTGGGHLGNGHQGDPDIMFLQDIILLPGVNGTTVSVEQMDYHTETNVNLVPVPSVHMVEGIAEEVYGQGAAYKRGGLVPTVLAEIVDPGMARDRCVAGLRVWPIQYDPVTKSVRVYDRLVVRVRFGPRDKDLRVRRVVSSSDLSMPALNTSQAASWYIDKRSMKKVQASPLAVGSWYRFDIAEEGVYRLSRSWFQDAGIDMASMDPRTIRVFNSGGRELPADIDAARPDAMQEIAIQVVGEDDGKFDANDYVLVYARGPSGFAFDSTTRKHRHYINRFDNSNSYLLTFGGARGKRMEQQTSLSNPAPYRPSWFTGREYVEEEQNNLLSSGKLWLAKKLTAGLGSANQMVYTHKLPGVVSGDPILYRFSFYSQSDLLTSNYFSILESGLAVGTVPMGTVDFNTDREDIAAASGIREFTISPSLTGERSNLTIIYTASNPDRNKGGYVDWVEWLYHRTFNPLDDVMRFPGPDTTADVEYVINGFTSSDINLFEVSDYSAVRRIVGSNISGGTLRFQARSELVRPGEYMALTSTAWKTPGAASRITNSDLLGTTGAAFIVIAPTEFLSAANRLKTLKESGSDAITTRVVQLSDIYNEFSSGVKDPTAIRNFIQYAYENWTPQPQYVLLLGDGHFDYKGYTTNEIIRVPVWESENSINLLDCYVSDDYFVCVSGSDDRVDLGLGRITAQDENEAEEAVNKIILYETGQDFGSWRNRVTFVADDGLTTHGDDLNTHTHQSEVIANALPSEIEQKKIYIVSYPTENTAQGRRKPEANRAIIDQVNQGTLVINYTGHGSESVWAHEQVLYSDVSIPQMNNATKLTFVAAATCTFGLYDRPNVRSGMEMILAKPDGGAIGGLCSPRVVISGQNSVFNETFFDNLFRKGREADGTVRRISQAVWSTKQRWYGDEGYEKFHLFCDPTVRLHMPRYRAALDSILVNGARVIEGKAQLRALSRVAMYASILKPDSTVWSDFAGTAQSSLFDAQRSVPVPEWSNWSYLMPGGQLFNGQAAIRDGHFKVEFIVPKDISYENNTGRFAVYFSDASVDGAGYSLNLVVGGSDSSAVSDTHGPDIQLYMDSRSFQPGDVVNERPTLLADLYDESGINMTGNGIGHNLEFWLDNSDQSTVLNSYYTGDLDSYKKGTIEYHMSGLAEGTHTLKLRAWDIYNNSTSAETNFRVIGSDRLAVTEVMPYPNPMTEHTAFTFLHNQSDPVNVEVQVYTVAGRMIRKIKQERLSERFVQIPWDVRDEDGDRPANGIYFFKLIVETVDGSRHSEEIGKLAIAR